MSEAGVIAALFAGLAIYKASGSAALSGADNQTLGERVGYYVAPPAGFVTTLAAAYWAAHGIDSGGIATGFLVGVISVAITLPFFLSAKREHRVMYGIAFLLRFVAGAIGGVLGQPG